MCLHGYILFICIGGKQTGHWIQAEHVKELGCKAACNCGQAKAAEIVCFVWDLQEAFLALNSSNSTNIVFVS